MDLFLFPVMPDVLDVIIVLEDVEHLFHVGDVLGLIELLVVLRDHLNLRTRTCSPCPRAPWRRH